ncbi:MAG: hypothetical protein AAB479_00415 [Patescibacteria group bacterium]
MQTWIFLVVIAQFISAVVVLLDKYLIRQVSQPAVYAFIVSVLSGAVIVLLPFGVVSVPSFIVLVISLGAATSFTLSLVMLYRALAIADASDVAPVMGGIAAIATLAFSWLVLRDRLPDGFVFGFALLVLGTFLVSHFRLSRAALTYALVAGIAFGLSSVLLKTIFFETSFLNGFFWSRMANVTVALLFLIPGSVRRSILADVRQSKSHLPLVLLANKLLAGTAFFLTLLAIKLGNVSLVSALAGLQFMFLLLFAAFASARFPQYFPEEMSTKAFAVKIVAVFFILTGFLILFI